MKVALVCIGDIGFLRGQTAVYSTENMDVPTSFLYNFDFLIKGSNDLSVLMTGYAAASAHLPVVTTNTGFFSHFVTGYNLGFVFSCSGDSFHESLRRNFDFDDFLLRHNWEVAAQRLISAL